VTPESWTQLKGSNEKGIELQAEMSVAQFFFVSFYILIWLVKTILLYLPTERGFKKLKEPRVLDIIKVNCLVNR